MFQQGCPDSPSPLRRLAWPSPSPASPCPRSQTPDSGCPGSPLATPAATVAAPAHLPHGEPEVHQGMVC